MFVLPSINRRDQVETCMFFGSRTRKREVKTDWINKAYAGVDKIDDGSLKGTAESFLELMRLYLYQPVY
jgi:hypothetical protein